MPGRPRHTAPSKTASAPPSWGRFLLGHSQMRKWIEPIRTGNRPALVAKDSNNSETGRQLRRPHFSWSDGIGAGSVLG